MIKSRTLAKICAFFFERAVDRNDLKSVIFWNKNLLKVAPVESPPKPSSRHIKRALEMRGLKIDIVQTAPDRWEVNVYEKADRQ